MLTKEKKLTYEVNIKLKKGPKTKIKTGGKKCFYGPQGPVSTDRAHVERGKGKKH